MMMKVFSKPVASAYIYHLIQVIWWRNEKARPKNFNAVSHNNVRP